MELLEMQELMKQMHEQIEEVSLSWPEEHMLWFWHTTW